MAKVLRTMTVYDCPCGDLHEVCYTWREGSQAGGLYLCGSTERTVPLSTTERTTRTVTLGLDIVGEVKMGRSV
jgi:hypothetical protein